VQFVEELPRAGMMNIGVVGVGGVGGYFGGKLCQVDGVHISFVARGEHLAAIQQSGLLLSSETDGECVCKPSQATDDFRKLTLLDLCLVCVKEFDLTDALCRLESKIGNDTVVLPLLNGVDVHARARSVITGGMVLPACVYVGTHIERPGKVVQKGGACKILFGPDPARPEFTPDKLVCLFEQAGIKCEWTLNIQAEIWKKFIFICGYGLVSAASGKTLGQILEDDLLRSETKAVMAEAVALAKASGVSLPENAIETGDGEGAQLSLRSKDIFPTRLRAHRQAG
jgi:2-dehydropantoate 2-reductase